MTACIQMQRLTALTHGRSVSNVASRARVLLMLSRSAATSFGRFVASDLLNSMGVTSAFRAASLFSYFSGVSGSELSYNQSSAADNAAEASPIWSEVATGFSAVSS